MSNPVESLKRYEFKRVIENLEGKKGQATELITIYIPPDKQISDVVSQLKESTDRRPTLNQKARGPTCKVRSHQFSHGSSIIAFRRQTGL
jgi:Peptide chain release factor 1 (eRF1)